MLRLEKKSYKEFDYEKIFLRLENSPPPTPPHNWVRPKKVQFELSLLIFPTKVVVHQWWSLSTELTVSITSECKMPCKR